MYGVYYSSSVGIFKAYITNMSNLVLIKYSDDKKILLSPEKPEEFVNTIAQIRTEFINS
jgi:hypothetical protein